ncbi:uncharacterized protein DUF898 [Melghiribacillus thermohalophilus]|uniref:Uncharacterized protein DUF898 n=1 Tax=Melghiribacillus thermohalophilus TaxID=1324956 RepID=A0A4R3N3S3_9BACI|nr:DUF898 family protein [Melghiribacillus thermohalophilus]TCT23404.1 uncharacterized protein DUF898 [Melghiribacillus thermohalophilus]
MEQAVTKKKESFFDGSRLEYIGISILGLLLTVFTVGLLYPYSIVMKMRWDVRHTVIDGKRLYFTGSAAGLFGTWIKIWLLGVITFTIYFWFASSRIKKWKVSHMHFE